MPRLPDLEAAVFALLRQVPPGRVTTYGAIARALGDVKAARWVGELLARHGHDDDCPCHRVVRATGELGLFAAGDVAMKRVRLESEGVVVGGDRVAVADCESPVAMPEPPLSALQQFQDQIAERVSEWTVVARPRFYCGLDVAYPRDGLACGAAVVLDAETLETIHEVTIGRPAPFPYIPGYLAFRELPVLLELWAAVRPEVGDDGLCWIDGNGRLHPRRAGIACCFGVLANVPTIGVGKSLLCGRVEATVTKHGSPVLDVDELIGMACRSTRRKPLYVSVGHRISLESAVEHVQRCLTTHHLPEPAHRADRLSKRKRPVASA
jgi:deoxyribonuclease V